MSKDWQSSRVGWRRVDFAFCTKISTHSPRPTVVVSRRPPPFGGTLSSSGFSFDSFGLRCVALFTLRIKRVDEKLPAAFAFWGRRFWHHAFSLVFSFRAQILQVGGVGGSGFLFSSTAVRAPSLLMNFTLLKGNCE